MTEVYHTNNLTPLLEVDPILKQEEACSWLFSDNRQVEQPRFLSTSTLNVCSNPQQAAGYVKLLRPECQAQWTLTVPILQVHVEIHG